MMTELELPSWNACYASFRGGVATPLEKFIFYHEVGEKWRRTMFRNDLVAALNEVISDEHS